jgi:O-antigen/teichoic acid export membrane protein
MSEIVHFSLKTAVKGTTLVLFGTALSNIIWFITKFLIIRNSTIQQVGIYSLVIAVAGVFSLVASLGVHEGATKYVSIFLGESKRADAEAVCKAAIQIGIISGLAAFIFLFLFSGTISKNIFYKPELETPLKIISCYIPFSVLSLILVWILRGYGLIKARAYYLEIGIPLFFLFFLSVFLVLKLPFASIFYAYTLSGSVVFLAISGYAYRQVGLSPIQLRGGAYHKQLLQFSLSILVLAVMLVVFGSTDTIMLGRYASSTDVGIYNISMLLANLLTFPFLALGFVFMPIAGEMIAKQQTPELKRTYQILTKWTFSASLPLFFILFLFPEMTITLLFGNRFILSVVPLRILSIGFFIQTLMGTSIVLIVVGGLTSTIRNIAVFGTALNIVLNYVLIKLLDLGCVGAAIATMLSYSAVSFINFVALYRSNGIQPFTTKYIRPICGAVIMGTILYIIAKVLPLYVWMLPLYLTIFIAGYFLLLLLTKSVEIEDFVLLKAMVEKTGLKLRWVERIIYIFAKHYDALNH